MNLAANAVPETLLTWQPPQHGQTGALRSAGLSVQDLRDADFRWSRAQQWEAPLTAAALAIVERLNGAPKPTEPATVGEVVEVVEPAVSAPAAKQVPTAKVEALRARMVKRAEHMEAPRDSHTPKKMAFFMNARREAGHIRRALVIVDRWMVGPTLPVPTHDQFLDAAAQTQTHVANGYHDYLVDSGKERPTECPVALGLRAMMAAGQGSDRVELKPDVAVMEAQARFGHIPGFFPTPEALVARMVEAADLSAGMTVLEPSAGKGDIAIAVKMAGANVECVEVAPRLVEILKAKGLSTTEHDFLSMPASPAFDAVLMNPPFEKGADVEHVMHAWGFVAEGGRLVAIVSAGSLQRQDRRATIFQEWLAKLGAEITDNGQAFTEAFRRTGVATSLVVINK